MRRATETLIAVGVAVLFVACGLTTTQKTGMAEDATSIGAVVAKCKALQAAAGGSGGTRAAVDAQCEAELDRLDAQGAGVQAGGGVGGAP